VILTLLCPAASATPIPPEALKLAPHRAVYDLKMARGKDSGAYVGLNGRLVFEFKGSVCEGYTQNLRYVMSLTDKDGTSTTDDLRSSTWETTAGDQFHFKVDDYQNDQEDDASAGSAERKADRITVAIDKPSKGEISLGPGTLFPVQHTIALLTAALKGEHMMTANLFDGSAKGAKAFFTNSVIGPVRPAGGDNDLEPVKNVERLKSLRSWPVAIAYYDAGSGRAEGIPEHEMSFQFYENGVIRNLAIDYGTVSVKGTLSSIEFYEPSKCP
jgi:hypothetical protein